MPRTLTLLVGAGLVAGSILPVAADRALRAPIGPRVVASSQLAASHSPARGPQEAEALVPPPSALMAVGGPALFVVGNLTLSAADTAVKNRLEGLGFSLTIMTGSSVQDYDANGMALVYVSSSASASSVNSKFRDVEVPVVVAQSGIFDDMKMTSTTSGTHFGTTGSQTQIVMTAAAAGHPLAAGLTGTKAVATSSTFAWGQIAASGVKAANLTGSGSSPNRATVFGYEPGAVMFGSLAAPARRVGFFLGSSTLNATGWTLFDGAATWASNKVAAPYFSPWGGEFTSPPSVEILCDTPGAQIYYTTDGSLPTTSSTPYTAPVVISTMTTLSARAFFSNWAPSDAIGSAYYLSDGTVADPVLVPNGGSGVDSVTASITSEPGSTVHYTTDGSEPQDYSPVYSGMLMFTATTELKVRGFRLDYTPSATVSATFHVTPPTPTIDLPSGTYPIGQTTTVTANAPDVVMHYSISGQEPTEQDPQIVSGGSIPIGNFTLKVNAWRSGQTPSPTAQATYNVTGSVNSGAVAAGPVHSLVLRPDGTVAQWGYQLGATPRLVAGISGAKAIAPGPLGTSFVIKTDGTVWTWGPGAPPTAVAGLANIVALSVGWTHSLALDASGVLWAWGGNASGQLGNGTTTASATPVSVSGLSAVTAFSAGAEHSLAVTSDGYAWAWGSNGSRRLGDGTYENQLLPVPVLAMIPYPYGEVAKVFAGGRFSALLSVYGGVATWGDNQSFQLGLGSPYPSFNSAPFPMTVSLPTTASLSTGWFHTLVAGTDGRIRAWGNNYFGQLGDGTTESRYYPAWLAAPLNVVQVSASPSLEGYWSYSHSLALAADGTVWAWGSNLYGQVGDGTTTQRNSPVSVYQIPLAASTAPPVLTPPPGDYETGVTVALTAEPGASIRYTVNGGTASMSSPVYTGPIPVTATDTTISAVAVGPSGSVSSVVGGEYDLHVAALQVDPPGGVFATTGVPVTIACATPGATIHYTYDGSDPQPGDSQIASGGSLTLVASGTLKVRAFKTGLAASTLRSETYTLTGTPVDGRIVAGPRHSLARAPSGGMWGWGENGYGTVGDGSDVDRPLPTVIPSLAGATALAAGADHSLRLHNDQVWAWGADSSGQLGNGAPNQSSLAPVLVPGLTDVTAISARGSHSLALRADGTVRSWGYNANGQLGDGTVNVRDTPIPVGGLAGVTITSVSAGSAHSLGLDTLGRVWSWGANDQGQLGDGTQTQRLSPVLISGFGGLAVTAVSAGGSFSLALTSDGRAWAWGANNVGQLGIASSVARTLVPTRVWGLKGVTAIAAGSFTGLAATPTGDLWSWGQGGYVGDGTFTTRIAPVRVPGLSGVTRIASGAHSFAVTHDGTAWAWGSGSDGAVGDGTTEWRLSPVRISGPGYAWNVGMPWFTPTLAPLTLTADLPVTVTSATPGATIHYTLTGVDPTEADSVIASGASLTLTQSATLKARAWMGTTPASSVASAAYSLKPPMPHTYTINGTYLIGTLIQMTSPHPGATLHFRKDGLTVTASDPEWPVGGLAVDGPMALRVNAFKSGWTTSDTRMISISAKAQPPTMSPAGGAYTGAQAVVLSTTATEARIHYRTDGRLPTTADPFVLSGQSILVERSQTVHARVWRENWMLGDVAAETYTIDRGPAAAPQVTPPAGTFASAQTVVLSTATPGATIRYTLDGSEPTATSFVYSTGLVIDSPSILRARAYAVDFQPSATTVASYTIGTNLVGRPRFSLPSGTYANHQRVLVSTPTTGAIVRYTIDGTDPDESDPTFPTLGLEIDGELHLKARAFKYGLTPSGITAADYVVAGTISAGGSHSAVLRTDGSLWLWGYGASGALGNGTPWFVSRPQRLFGAQSWAAVSAGSNYTLGLAADGRAWAWGHNASGELGDGTNAQKNVPTLVASLQDVVAVSAGFPRNNGGSHSLALKADGTVWAWGSNAEGQLGNGTTTPSLVPIQVPGLSGITRIVTGYGLSLALKTDGAGAGIVYVWGYGAWSQLGDGAPFDNYEYKSLRPRAVLDGVVRMAAGAYHVEVVKSDGSVWTWGSLQGWSPTPAIRNAVPALVTGLSSVRAVSAGNGFAVAVKTDGTAVSWGWNADYRLGTGSSGSFDFTPAPVVGVADAVDVSATTNHALVLRKDGSVLAWGANDWGQIGDGTQTDRATAFEVPFPPLPSDADNDGLPSEIESASGCDAYNPDTNGDGLLDGAAVAAGFSCADLDMDNDGLQNLVERQRGLDPFRPDTDDDGSNDSADCFPLDPTRWQCPTPDPNDQTPPVITLTSPTNATLVSSVP